MTELTGRRPTEPLEERIGRLEDIEAIKNLKHLYAHYCDKGYDADRFVTLFVEDSSWESNAFGVYHGRDEIHAFIAGIGGEILWALHYMVNPVIDVAEDGQTATGKWVLLEPATMTAAEGEVQDAVIITATYEDEFVKVDGEWRFKRVSAHFHQVSNLDRGWVRQPFRNR
jgi:hypothetical protein